MNNPIIVDIHTLLVNETTREYVYFVRVNFNSKDCGNSIEGPFRLIPPEAIRKDKKWEEIYVFLAGLSLMRQRISATEPAPNRTIIVYTDHPKFAKYLQKYPQSLENVPKCVGHLLKYEVEAATNLNIMISRDSFKWKLRQNGRTLLRKFISGDLEINVHQDKIFTPIKAKRREPDKDTQLSSPD